MSEPPLRVLVVIGSLHRQSVTRVVLRCLARQLATAGAAVDVLDFGQEPLPLYDPDTAARSPGFAALKARVERADVLLLGTPDYHGSISSALKNFLDHFWHEFVGKLFANGVRTSPGAGRVSWRGTASPRETGGRSVAGRRKQAGWVFHAALLQPRSTSAVPGPRWRVDAAPARL